jgi:hypothetical protein
VKKREILMIIEKPSKKSSFIITSEDIPVDFTWSYKPEGCISNDNTGYKVLLKKNFKFNPGFHGFRNADNSKSDDNSILNLNK